MAQGIIMGLMEIFDMLRPVGSYYETSDSTFDPASAGWFGTWVEETEDRVLVAKSSSATLNGTGGENTHTLTQAETPAHTHRGNMVPANSGQGAPSTRGNTTITTKWNTILNNNTYISSYYGLGNYNTTYYGGGGAHENRQPYIIVRRFRRSA